MAVETEAMETSRADSLRTRSSTASASDLCVELDHVSKLFGSVAAVSDVSLEVRNGEFFSLLGPSGCGKTTTLRLIAGFEKPDSGALRIHAREMTGVPPHRRPVNTVFQSYALFTHMTVFENVAFGLRERGVQRAEIQQRARRALELVQLEGYENRATRKMSGGQQQRVALARAIVNEPAVLLLDEPLGALDLKLRRSMQFELKALQRKLGMTFLYVTHDQEEALSMSDRIAVMANGRVSQLGTPEEVYEAPASAYVAGFVGEANLLDGSVVAVGGDIITVELAGGRRVGGRTRAGASPAMKAAVCVAIRPERVTLSACDGGGLDQGAALTGTVEEVLFVGANRKIMVSLAGGQRVAALVPTASSVGPVGEGTSVLVTWEPRDAVVVYHDQDSDALATAPAATSGERVS
jgi:spermidine/putrescine transport system ATP-binding protein